MTETTDTPSPDEIVSIFDIAETDANAEEGGRWFKDVFGNNSNIDLKLRRMTSKKSLEARRNLDKGFRKHLRNGQYPEHIAQEIVNRQIANAVVVEWKGVYDRDKKPIPCDPEHIYALLTKLPDVRNIIVQLTMNMDNFRVEDREAAEKN